MFEHTVLYWNRPGAAPPGHPLTTLDHVVLTPHGGAGRLDAFRATIRFGFANLRRFVNGEPPLERVAETWNRLTQPLCRAAGCLAELDGIGPGR